jgi:glycosyltransferase involved in cell wall biosynthesis
MGSSPRIAVLLPVFNRTKDLTASLASLRDQGAAHTVVIVDDGSQPPVVLPSSTSHDVALLRTDANRGITSALNLGLEYIYRHKFEYVARLDAGDRMLPGRLDAQLEFLERHREHVIVGGNVRFAIGDREIRPFRLPTTDSAIRRRFHLRTAMFHPAVMMRTAALQQAGGYSTEHPHAEDYDLFMRLLRCGGRAANLEQDVIVYAISESSISSLHRRAQELTILRILWREFDYLLWESYVGLARRTLLTLFPELPVRGP